jgi:hypothetical protein
VKNDHFCLFFRRFASAIASGGVFLEKKQNQEQKNTGKPKPVCKKKTGKKAIRNF